MPKMESTLFAPAKCTFSENFRCLNFPLLVGTLSRKRLLSLPCFIFAGQNVHSGKFKHLKYSENVNFVGTNNVKFILTGYLGQRSDRYNEAFVGKFAEIEFT